MRRLHAAVAHLSKHIAAVVSAVIPPRCPTCRVRAVAVDEYEASSSPRLVAIVDRCPICGAVIARTAMRAAGE